MKKTYNKPSFREYRLQTTGLIAKSLNVAVGDGTKTDDPTSELSKAFWGGSIFDDDTEDEDYVDEIVP